MASYLSETYDDTANGEQHYRTTVGSLWINATDLMKVLMLLCAEGRYNDEPFLQPETVALMLADQNGLGSVSEKSKTPYGLCVAHVSNLMPSRMLYGHSGMDGAVMCDAYFDPLEELCIVMLTNGSSQVRDNRISILAHRLVPVAYQIAGIE